MRRFFLLILVTIPNAAYSDTIQVPGDYPAIQTAITAAAEGDRIIVAAGTYVENINFLGKSLKLKAESGPSVTVIDGGQAGTVVTFENGEGNSAVLDGFTIQNGTGTSYSGPAGLLSYGGGILCKNASSPTVINNLISGNWANQGAGLCCIESSEVIVKGNIFDGNIAATYSTTASAAGGGIASYDSAATIVNNLIVGNSAYAQYRHAHGGGIRVHGTAVVFQSNTVAFNIVSGDGTGTELAGGGVAGTQVWSSFAVKNSILFGNAAPTGGQLFLVGNLTVAYCDLQGGLNGVEVSSGQLTWGAGMLDADPLFVSGQPGEYFLSHTATGQSINSPCVDAADPSSSMLISTTRLDQVQDHGDLDMGYHHPLHFDTLPSGASLGLPDQTGSSIDPVNTATGNFYRQETDLSIKTRGLPLRFTRCYNSLDTASGSLGKGWTHSYAASLDDSAPNGQVSVRWGDGRTDFWTEDQDGIFNPTIPHLYDTLVHNGDGTWTVTRKDLTAHTFDGSGRLIAVADRNDNTTTLDYTHPVYTDRATQIIDPAGRTVALSYSPATGRLIGITDFDSPPRTLSFSYTGGLLTQVTDTMNETIDYTYDTNAFLETVTDQRGVVIVTNAYDGGGRVTDQWDGNNNHTAIYYNTPETNQTTLTREVTVGGVLTQVETVHTHDGDFNLLLSIEDALGDLIVYAYDDSGNRISMVDQNGQKTGFAYDDRGNLVTLREADDPADSHDGGITFLVYENPGFPDLVTGRTDSLGFATEWTYDGNGNLLNEERWIDLAQTESVTRSWTYNGFGQALTETNERGFDRQWIYNADGRLTEEIDREGNHTWYGHDALWRVTQVTDGRGSAAGDPAYTTSFTYDDADLLTLIQSPPVGPPVHPIMESFDYDEIGNRTQITDGKGYVTTFIYDDNGNLTEIDEELDGSPNGRMTLYTYDELNRQISWTDGNSHTTTYLYDHAGRLLEIEDEEGNLWVYTRDAHGNVLTETDPSDVTLTYEYDARHRLVLVRDELGNERSWEYDKRGRTTKETDADARETVFDYDAFGRLVSVLDASGGRTDYSYDEAGNLTGVQDADEKNISIRQYNRNNRLSLAEDGIGFFRVYGYDEAGNLDTIIDADLQQTDLTFDAVNRLTRVDYPDLSAVTFRYDDNHNRIRMTDPNGVSTFTYDELDRIKSSTDSFGQAVNYRYDTEGHRTKVIYPDLKEVDYIYDGADRLTCVRDWASRETSFTYDGMRVDTMTYPSGIVETRGYDDAGRLASSVTRNAALSTLFSYAWMLNGEGHPTSSTETGTLQPEFPESVISHFRHDNDDRLVSSVEFQARTGATHSITGVTPFSSGGTQGKIDPLQNVYQYDGDGNLIRQSMPGSVIDYVYDSEDRLVSRTRDGSSVNHVYDGLGHRIARTDGGTTTQYVLDLGRPLSQVLCETDNASAITAYYIYGPNEIVARIGSDGTQRYYHLDYNCNVAALTDENENITDRYAYTPFGELGNFEGTSPNPFTYAGGKGVMEEVDGLYFMRARFYDSANGRFLSKDPVEGDLSRPLTLHRYLYAGDNPVVFTDPGGTAAEATKPQQDSKESSTQDRKRQTGGNVIYENDKNLLFQIPHPLEIDRGEEKIKPDEGNSIISNKVETFGA